MNAIRFAILTAIFALAAFSATGVSGKDRDRLIGAWHLAAMVDANGEAVTGALPTGMLIYTRDGHVSVQLMYPKSAGSLSNEYVHEGYEASFGSFDVNEAAHTVTHHILGSNTGDLLVGKDLPRVYQFSPKGELIIRSARRDEHWSVRWVRFASARSHTPLPKYPNP